MKKTLKLLSRYLLEVLSLVMLTAALVFYLDVQQMKSKLNESNPEMFSTGDMVTVVKAIDGDEVIVQNADGFRVIVRILGVKSFSPTISDPKLPEYGKIAYNHLGARLKGKSVRLELNDPKVDGKKRLLSYLYLKEDSGKEVDIGKELVEKGYSLVYLRYDFSNIQDYIKVEQTAENTSTGFWSNSTIVKRSQALKRIWLEEKLQDD